MTGIEDKAKTGAIKTLLERDEDFVCTAVQSLVQAALEAEMTEALAAEKGERTEGRLGYRSGYYSRALITRVGTLELRVPQDRGGRFSTELFERYQRSEKALVGTLAEMYVQGVSTRKVKAVTEALCGHSFSASSISAINKRLDEGLRAFSERRLDDAYPYLIVDARYERVREGGIIASQAVLVAVAVDWLLPAAAGAPQAHEEHQHAGAAQPGDQAPHPCGADISQRRELFASGSSISRGDARELAGGHALSQHGSPARAQETAAEASGMSGPACPKHRAVLAALNTAARRYRGGLAASVDRRCARRTRKSQAGTEKRRPAEQKNITAEVARSFC